MDSDSTANYVYNAALDKLKGFDRMATNPFLFEIAEIWTYPCKSEKCMSEDCCITGASFYYYQDPSNGMCTYNCIDRFSQIMVIIALLWICTIICVVFVGAVCGTRSLYKHSKRLKKLKKEEETYKSVEEIKENLIS